MSLINEALKKAQAAASENDARGAAPFYPPAGPRSAAAGRRHGRGEIVFFAAAAIGGIAAVAALLSSTPSAPRSAQAAVARVALDPIEAALQYEENADSAPTQAAQQADAPIAVEHDIIIAAVEPLVARPPLTPPPLAEAFVQPPADLEADVPATPVANQATPAAGEPAVAASTKAVEIEPEPAPLAAPRELADGQEFVQSIRVAGLPELVLAGISWSPAGNAAIINDRIVHEADVVDGFTIVAITPKKVELWRDGRKLFLHMP